MFGARRMACGWRLVGKVTEHNAKLRPRDRVKLKILVFSDRGDAMRFWNGAFSGSYTDCEEAMDPRADAWVQETVNDSRFFAVAVFTGPPDLENAAHEAVHVACRYVERFGFKKSWRKEGDGYEIGSFEEQRAYAAGAAFGVIWETEVIHAKGET